jgi:hypothetical protein
VRLVERVGDRHRELVALDRPQDACGHPGIVGGRAEAAVVERLAARELDQPLVDVESDVDGLCLRVAMTDERAAERGSGDPAGTSPEEAAPGELCHAVEDAQRATVRHE